MRKVLVVLAAVALTMTSCSDDGDPTVAEPTEAPVATTPAATPNDHGTETFTTEEFEVELELDNFYFSPTFIKAPGEATAKLELVNEGDAQHTFTIDKLEVDEVLDPGVRQPIEIKLGTDTRYVFYCRFHVGQGMSGAFMPH